jgi:hypothetical protein
MIERLRDSLRPVVYLSSNWVSLLGVVMVTTAGVLWLLLLPTMFRGHSPDPYIGALEFLVLPMVFFLGLGLIPLGIWLTRRKGHLPSSFPPLDLSNPRFKKLLTFLAVTTALNVFIGAQLAYRAVSYMETTTFCGQTCHVVMKPEFTAYQNSPHARVECVSCHIGPGANWFVKSKISGAWQVISVTFNLYDKPIPTPVRNLRPARETCEVCHWPQKFGGNRIRLHDQYSDDEKAVHKQSVLMMRIGGGTGYEGIHGAHMGPGVVIRYAHSDEKRQTIPWVEYSRGTAEPLVFAAKDFKGDGPGNLPVRTMDCIDCHNRPSHTYELPERVVDRFMADGQIDASLPFVHKTAVEVLKAKYATTEDSERDIPAKFTAFYKDKYPQVYAQKREAVERSAKAVLTVFSRNVFPEMNVQWGSYPNNLGHNDFPGCFRCHDERESKQGGKTVPQDCNTCHQLLAMEEENPKILTDLGLKPAAAGPTGGGK